MSIFYRYGSGQHGDQATPYGYRGYWLLALIIKLKAQIEASNLDHSCNGKVRPHLLTPPFGPKILVVLTLRDLRTGNIWAKIASDPDGYLDIGVGASAEAGFKHCPSYPCFAVELQPDLPKFDSGVAPSLGGLWIKPLEAVVYYLQSSSL